MKLILAFVIALLIGISQRIEAQGDETPLIIDGHNDLPYNLYSILQNDITNFNFDQDLSEDEIWGKCDSCFTDLPKLRKGRIGAQFWVAFVSCEIQYKDALGKTLDQIDVIKRLVAKYPNDLTLVTSVDGIEQAFKDGKIGSLIAVEGGHSMDSRLGVLRMFYDLGVRYMTLTHSCNTPWADNSHVDDTKPVHDLTEYGKAVVLEMNRLGMLVDLSHVSHAVMNAALQMSKAPIIFSHSSAYGVRPHNRNVRDDTLDLVKAKDSIVMVNFYNGFVSSTPNTATIQDVADHINYIADKIGVDFVGIGADYDGVDRQPIGLENVSKYPDLFTLLKGGRPDLWTAENLAKLANGNLIRVFRKVEQIRDELKDSAPAHIWIPDKDLNDVPDDEKLWACRTLLNNTSPGKNAATKNNLIPITLVLVVLTSVYNSYF